MYNFTLVHYWVTGKIWRKITNKGSLLGGGRGIAKQAWVYTKECSFKLSKYVTALQYKIVLEKQSAWVLISLQGRRSPWSDPVCRICIWFVLCFGVLMKKGVLLCVGSMSVFLFFFFLLSFLLAFSMWHPASFPITEYFSLLFFFNF